MGFPRSLAVRLALGTLTGAAAWPLIGALLPQLPEPVRFAAAWALFTFGPGVLVAGLIARELDPLRRAIVLLGVGSAIAPVIIDLLGRAGAVPAFPYLASALTGAGVAIWTSAPAGGRTRARTPRADLAGAAVVLLVAAALGAVVFWHRLDVTPDGIRLMGEYDTADMAYYAVEAAEASHTIPPTASYYSGHMLNAAYFCHLVPAMIHRYGGVPLLPLYFQYAWPAFLMIGTLAGFAMVRLVANARVAALSMVMLALCSDFSYLAEWFLPKDPGGWDYVLWPTNFLSPTMMVLFFNTWGPTLPVFFTVLFALVRGLQTRSWRWLALGALVVGILFEFKPFAFLVIMTALAAATVFTRDRAARMRFAVTVLAGSFFTLPSIVKAATIAPEDRRSQLVVQFLPLVDRMLIKLGLTQTFTDAAARLVPVRWLETPVVLLAASVPFFLVGTGIRWMGAPGVWRALRPNDGPDRDAWRLLAWGVVAGFAIPLVIATDPYIDTLNFYMTGLYLLWIFTAAAMVRLVDRRGVAGVVVAGALIAGVLPSSLHYLSRRWHDDDRPARAALSQDEVRIAAYLRTTDPESTVILHDRPLEPSMLAVLSERRIVLGWDVKYSAVGGEDRLRDVEAFFASATGDPAAALAVLARYRVTHLLLRKRFDRVHPAVLARLTLVYEFPDVALYTVPAGVARALP
jgi:hypothetical protein